MGWAAGITSYLAALSGKNEMIRITFFYNIKIKIFYLDETKTKKNYGAYCEIISDIARLDWSRHLFCCWVIFSIELALHAYSYFLVFL